MKALINADELANDVAGAEALLDRHQEHKLAELHGRWDTLKAKASQRRQDLEDSLQQFSRDVDEIEAWISEKLQTATDESYKDPTNIQVRTWETRLGAEALLHIQNEF
uniref:Spectrin alpha, non-erythrocytic 1 n=1 Tax=Neolamprologus brichardi TaxID=32507 RepID=A0A3Q4GFW4_NEOBR